MSNATIGSVIAKSSGPAAALQPTATRRKAWLDAHTQAGLKTTDVFGMLYQLIAGYLSHNQP